METEQKSEEKIPNSHIFAIRTTANREDQVMDFLVSNAKKRNIEVFSVIKPQGMRGYIFIEAQTRSDAEQAIYNIPYARGLLPKEVNYKDIDHMLEDSKDKIKDVE